MKQAEEITNYRREKREMCAKTEFAFTSNLCNFNYNKVS